MSLGHWLDAVIAVKGYDTEHQVLFMLSQSNTFAHLEIRRSVTKDALFKISKCKYQEMIVAVQFV